MARPPLRKPRKAARINQPADGNEVLALHASLRRRLTQIRSSELSLLLTFGETQDGVDVLVPLLDWQLFGIDLALYDDDDEPEGKGPELYSSLVALDNLAFLLHDMSADIHSAVKRVSAQSNGGTDTHRERMRYAAKMFTQASVHLMAAAETIEADLPMEGSDH
jgi:hypothetical protein